MSSSELFKSKGFSKLLDPEGECGWDTALESIFIVLRSVSLIISSWLDVRLLFDFILKVIAI